jgi:hypothetical protein
MCIKCGVLLTDENWRKSSQKHYQYTCKSCLSKAGTAWRNSKTDAEFLHYSAKTRAQKLDREFTITVADVEAVDTDTCPILGIPIKRYQHKSGGSCQQQPDSKSLDRIDANLGYVPGNIRVISWRANSLLKDVTPEELDKITAYHLSTKVNGC